MISRGDRPAEIASAPGSSWLRRLQLGLALHRPLYILLAVALVVPGVIAAMLAYHARGERLREAQADVRQTVHLLREHAQRVFEAEEHIIARIDQHVRGMPWAHIAGSREVHDLLRRLRDQSEHVDGLWLVAPEGRTVASADYFPVPETHVADRSYFVELRESDILYFGPVIVGRLKGNLNFNLSRRRGSPTEQFDGLILVTLDLDYFVRFWKQVASDARHVAGLFREDGVILARYPGLDGVPTKLPADSPVLVGMGKADEGLHTTVSTLDGTRRIYGYARVGDYPVFVGYGVDEGAVLAPWWRSAVRSLWTAAAISMALALMVLLAIRQSRRERAAIASWQASTARLQAEVERRAQAEMSVAEKEALLKEVRQARDEREAVLESIGDAFFALDAELRFVYANGRALELWHRTPADVLGGRLLDVFPQLAGSDAYAAYARVAGEQQAEHFETFSPVLRRWLSVSAYPAGQGGISVYFRDITERRQAEERQGLLLRELSHRVKNILALVRFMARQTGLRSATVADFRATFEGRLDALRAAHDLLTASGWEGAALPALTRAALEPRLFGARVKVEVPDVPLDPAMAQTLALILHELATNATKYGALSRPGGEVQLSGQLEDGMLVLRWRESGGPEVAAPGERGFGTTLVTEAIRYQHGGAVSLDWASSGLVCTMRLPLPGGLSPPRRSAA